MGLREIFEPMKLDDFGDYNEYWKKRGVSRELARRDFWIAENLPETGTLLDVGCGDGVFLAYLWGVKPGIDARGIDVSAEATKRARARGFNAQTKPYEHGHFDYVVFQEVLEHIADPEKWFKILRDEIRPALVFVTIPNAGMWKNRLRLLFGRFPHMSARYHAKEHIRHWTVADFKQWAKHYGFTVLKIAGQSKKWPKSIRCGGMMYMLELSRDRARSPH